MERPDGLVPTLMEHSTVPTLMELRKSMANGTGGCVLGRAVSIIHPDVSPSPASDCSLASRALGVLSPATPLQRSAELRSVERIGWAACSRSPRSPEAELSARSAFAASESSPPAQRASASSAITEACPVLPGSDAGGAGCNAVKVEELQRDQASPAAAPASASSGLATPPQPRPFLRKGARMARSQPRGRATSAPRLQPREAFKQAAVLTASPARRPRPSGARSLTRERSASSTQPRTPQRSRARLDCAITPANLSLATGDKPSGPRQRGDAIPPTRQRLSLEKKVTGCFSWQDPGCTLDQENELSDDAPPSQVLSPERSQGIATLANEIHADRFTVVEQAVLTEPLAPSLETGADPRDLLVEFEDATSTLAGLEPSAAAKMRVLDSQIAQFRRDNEALARLRKQAELAEFEFNRERDALRREVDEERATLKRDVERERQALQRERSRLSQEAEAKRRASASERLELRDRLDNLQEELTSKDSHWQKSVDRLQRQVDDLSRKNRDLLELQTQPRADSPPPASVSSGCRDVGGYPSIGAQLSSQIPSRQTIPKQSRRNQEPVPALVAEVPPLPGLASSASPRKSCIEPVSEFDGGRCEPRLSDFIVGGDAIDTSSDASALTPPQCARLRGHKKRSADHPPAERAVVEAENHRGAVVDVSAPKGNDMSPGNVIVRDDGRTEQCFEDGCREVIFPSGLRKVLWPDGRTSVFFQNGDVKETHPDGNVIYRYQSTGAVQTTKPDGTDVYRFANGQVEWHYPDKSKEIDFANGARKRISADGFEEVSPANGGGVWTPVATAAMAAWAQDSP